MGNTFNCPKCKNNMDLSILDKKDPRCPICHISLSRFINNPGASNKADLFSKNLGITVADTSNAAFNKKNNNSNNTANTKDDKNAQNNASNYNKYDTKDEKSEQAPAKDNKQDDSEQIDENKQPVSEQKKESVDIKDGSSSQQSQSNRGFLDIDVDLYDDGDYEDVDSKFEVDSEETENTNDDFNDYYVESEPEFSFFSEDSNSSINNNIDEPDYDNSDSYDDLDEPSFDDEKFREYVEDSLDDDSDKVTNNVDDATKDSRDNEVDDIMIEDEAKNIEEENDEDKLKIANASKNSSPSSNDNDDEDDIEALMNSIEKERKNAASKPTPKVTEADNEDVEPSPIKKKMFAKKISKPLVPKNKYSFENYPDFKNLYKSFVHREIGKNEFARRLDVSREELDNLLEEYSAYRKSNANKPKVSKPQIEEKDVYYGDDENEEVEVSRQLKIKSNSEKKNGLFNVSNVKIKRNPKKDNKESNKKVEDINDDVGRLVDKKVFNSNRDGYYDDTVAAEPPQADTIPVKVILKVAGTALGLFIFTMIFIWWM